MCGIAGFLGRFGRDDEELATLRGMADALAHRGPDASGTKILDGFCGLAHTRLSIIDLASGDQPMSDGDGRAVVTFNGEIFNYVELRQELEAEGYRFRTRSDTEVILAAYLVDGLDGIARLNGDFAFALWDRQHRRLVLARDRMGVRPLYVARRPWGLAFASETKALFRVPGIEPRIDPIALDQIFSFWAPLAPRTIFQGIEEVPPGHLLVADGSFVTVRPYWQLAFPDAAEKANGADERGTADHLRDLLTDATRIRLRSDVPVGSYLSGGLDSSIVSALARHEVEDRLRTFSVTFDDPEFDESAEQQAMVDALGTEHSAVLCRAADIGRVFPDVVRATERPILRTAPAPLFMLSDLVRRSGYKVVLTGEGADEVFAGYDLFKEAKIRRFCAADPASPRRPQLLKKLYPYLPAMRGQPQAYLQAFFGTGTDDTTDPLYSHLPRIRSTGGVKAFYGDELRTSLSGYDALDDLRCRLPAEFGRWHPLHQAQYLETTVLLPGYILSAQGDRVAMAHAVEGRFPFLDHRVVEFAAGLPPSWKLKGLTEKHILREAMAPVLPRSIARRPKQPYRAPDAVSFFGPAAPAYVEKALSREAVAAAGLFDPLAVSRLTAKCRAGRATGARDNMALVGILSSQLLIEGMPGQAANAAELVTA